VQSAPSLAVTRAGYAERYLVFFVSQVIASTLIAVLQKCDERPNEQGYCETCVRLRLQCLGFGAKRPEWLRVGPSLARQVRSELTPSSLQESRNVSEMRDKIKAFLAAQGMIKGHSGSGPRGSDHELPILRLEEDNTPSSSESPPTPTLSLSPSEPPRPLQHESSMREQRWIDGYGHSGMDTYFSSLPPTQAMK
jgi:hypothetical protein